MREHSIVHHVAQSGVHVTSEMLDRVNSASTVFVPLLKFRVRCYRLNVRQLHGISNFTQRSKCYHIPFWLK